MKVFLLLCVLIPISAWSTCDLPAVKNATFQEDYDKTDVIFVGKVLDKYQTTSAMLPLAIRFRIKLIYKGLPRGWQIKTVKTRMGDCGIPGLAQAEIESVWLVYANYVGNEVLMTEIGDPTSLLEKAHPKNIEFLEQHIVK